mmetsp:Transcript_16602/g.35049  ORF Transcript_16602/g.35049 Transcript_16602/m.35049 type:complete len:244 (-) Transcript_16602:282-1013(-)
MHGGLRWQRRVQLGRGRGGNGGCESGQSWYHICHHDHHDQRRKGCRGSHHERTESRHHRARIHHHHHDDNPTILPLGSPLLQHLLLPRPFPPHHLLHLRPRARRVHAAIVPGAGPAVRTHAAPRSSQERAADRHGFGRQFATGERRRARTAGACRGAGGERTEIAAKFVCADVRDYGEAVERIATHVGCRWDTHRRGQNDERGCHQSPHRRTTVPPSQIPSQVPSHAVRSEVFPGCPRRVWIW